MAEQVRPRRGREGNRWINERPSAQEVAEWFATVPLHEGMKHEPYVGGVTLIPAKEKSDEIVGYDDDGFAIVRENVQKLTWTPYMKVDTRIRYFWDLMDRHREEWVG